MRVSFVPSSMSSLMSNDARISCSTKFFFFKIDFDGFWLIFGTSNGFASVRGELLPSFDNFTFGVFVWSVLVGWHVRLMASIIVDDGDNVVRLLADSMTEPKHILHNHLNSISTKRNCQYSCSSPKLIAYRISDKCPMDYLWYRHHRWSLLCTHLLNGWIAIRA